MVAEKKSKKVLKIFSLVLVSVAVLIFISYFYLTNSSTVSAQIHIESGDVFVDGNQILEDMKLKEGNVIETKDNSFATVILYESVFINLESNTIINLEELTLKFPKVSQKKGETWNTFTKLSGVEEYSIQTGNSIASVRATAFGLRENYILGGEGEVEYKIDGDNFAVRANKVVEKIREEVKERDATAEEKQKIIGHKLRALKELQRLRDLELNKKPIILNMVKKRTGATDEELENYLEDIDNEVIDIDELVRQSPIEIESIDKIVSITKSIQEIKRDLR